MSIGAGGVIRLEELRERAVWLHPGRVLGGERLRSEPSDRRQVKMRTNREKMLAGELYQILDAELDAERRAAKELLRDLNRSDDPSEQESILRRLLGSIGQDSIVWPPFYCSYGKNTHLGDHVFLNYQCTILDGNEVRLGDHVMIGPAVQIYTAAHPVEADARNRGWETAKPVTLEDNVWVGGGAIILPGVTVGRNAVIGAGSVVSRDVPANTVVAGNPATVIREIEQ
jgi:maltose O-acetyltransferase